MDKIIRKMSKRTVSTLLLVVTMLLTTIIPVYADQAYSLDISPWAIEELN